MPAWCSQGLEDAPADPRLEWQHPAYLAEQAFVLYILPEAPWGIGNCMFFAYSPGVGAVPAEARVVPPHINRSASGCASSSAIHGGNTDMHGPRRRSPQIEGVANAKTTGDVYMAMTRPEPMTRCQVRRRTIFAHPRYVMPGPDSAHGGSRDLDVGCMLMWTLGTSGQAATELFSTFNGVTVRLLHLSAKGLGVEG